MLATSLFIRVNIGVKRKIIRRISLHHIKPRIPAFPAGNCGQLAGELKPSEAAMVQVGSVSCDTCECVDFA